MAILCMVYGHSGSGKSTSLRNFTDSELALINVNKKPLPFKNNFKSLNTSDYMTIDKAISTTTKKSIVIDDATYLMTKEFMDNADVKGFEKFNRLAANFYTLLNVASDLPDDTIVYFLGHCDTNDAGRDHFKTIGKLLDEKVVVEGLFTIVLKTVVDEDGYHFATQTNGYDTCKSPMGMFDSNLIDNDLKAVDTKIREFYGFTTNKAKENK